MRKILLIPILSLVLLSVFASHTNAQMMGGDRVADDHTASEEAEGKTIWEKLQVKQTVCADLKDEDFGVLGEYFMGQMLGSSHSAMNQMMVNMMGEQGEEQMHVVMGKRMSGCEPNAAYPARDWGFMPMINMMMGGGWLSPTGFNQENNSMMGNFGNWSMMGWSNWLFMVVWWVLIIVGVIALIKWLTRQNRHMISASKSALDVLKERYAKGEINKLEFEEKKKDLT